MLKKIKTEIAILGSGVGGATLAYELAKRGKQVIILERGPLVTRVGDQKSAAYFYDKYGRLKSKEGIIIYRTIMVGGTSVVSCGNGVRCLESELKNYGIDISEELNEAEKDLGVEPIDKRLIGKGTKRIMSAARGIGLVFKPMPKFINLANCIFCGNCILGCAQRAKWSALDFIKKSQDHGTKLITNFALNTIMVINNQVIGLGGSVRNEQIEVKADRVVIACGALETPKILLNLGLSAGNNLFCDLFIVVYGISKNCGLSREPTMAIVNDEFYKRDGFILSPFLDTFWSLMSINLKYYKLAIKRDKLLGIMIKIKDDKVGGVNNKGVISKIITEADKEKFTKGSRRAKEILIEADVNPKSIIITDPRGAHPGGTAAIGDVVDINHETKIKNLFVCDASALPIAPGLPPILTIIALSKRLAKIL